MQKPPPPTSCTTCTCRWLQEKKPNGRTWCNMPRLNKPSADRTFHMRPSGIFFWSHLYSVACRKAYFNLLGSCLCFFSSTAASSVLEQHSIFAHMFGLHGKIPHLLPSGSSSLSQWEEEGVPTLINHTKKESAAFWTYYSSAQANHHSYLCHGHAMCIHVYDSRTTFSYFLRMAWGILFTKG
jgi:hypothetical protein